MLDLLPVELLRLIFAYVQNKTHLLALSRVSRKFRSHVFPRLFEVLTIKSYDGSCLWDLDLYPHLAHDMIARVPKVLMAVKELQFSVPFEQTDLQRRKNRRACPHSSFKGESNASLMKLATKIAGLLSALPDNQLIGFRWDMQTCFPHALLGDGGYLVTHQNCIRKLSLITEYGCISGGPPLKEFANLRELSWKGFLSDDDCAALKAFFKLHHKRLTSLEVDFVNWEEVEYRSDLPEDDEDEDNSTPLTDMILPERKDDYESFLPNLQTLSLTTASFKGSSDRLINAFNLQNVKELRLLNCKLAVELLEYVARTDGYLYATKAELDFRHAGSYELEFDVVDFLASFDGLEDLFLIFESDYADTHHTEMILHHRDTLRRLVFHRRHSCMTEDASSLKQYCDSPLEETECGRFVDIFRETKLESVGVCGEPSKLQKSFQSIAPRVDSLKLLHLRFAGKAEPEPKFHKKCEACSDNSPWLEYSRALAEAQRNGTTLPRHSLRPSEAEIQIRWEQIHGVNWRDDEEEALEAFANWAFGSDGFPRLQVLASGDFSYGNRFVDTRTLWCRNARGSSRDKTWRTVKQSDIAENELIDANTDMMSACPVSPLFYSLGQGHTVPGIT